MQAEIALERVCYRRAEVAHVLGVSLATVDNWIRSGVISAHKLGASTVVKKEELDKLLEQNLKPIEARR